MAAITEMKPKKIRLGDLLIANKVISQEQLNTALADQKKSGRKLGRVLVENGFLSEDQLLTFLSQQLNIPYIDLRRYHYKPEVVRLIPEAYARRFRAIVLEDSRENLLVGMADPTDIFAYDELSRVLDRRGGIQQRRQTDSVADDELRRPLRLAVVKESELLKTIDRVYRRTEEISDLAQELHQELTAQGGVDLATLAETEGLTDAPVVKLLQSMFEDAVQVNASDIHIEPDEKELRIRFRLDGVLRVQTIADRRIASALVSRVKLMANLDISEKRLPQDGRTNIRIRDKNIDVRISTMPVQFGESVVMRLLNPFAGVLSLEQVGMPKNLLERFRRLIHNPNGMVLVTGPTGSGKTTTGHLVLSTLHTNDAISTALRLIDMGVEPFMAAASLRGIISQRLVRRICESCAEPYELPAAQMAIVRAEAGDKAETLKFKRGRGCTHCNGTGYSGRIGVFEYLEMDSTLVEALHTGDPMKFAAAAKSQPGFQALRRAAIILAAQGLTTMDQVARATFSMEE